MSKKVFLIVNQVVNRPESYYIYNIFCISILKISSHMTISNVLVMVDAVVTVKK